MADPSEKDVLKSVELELTTFGKRAKPKLALLEDLELCLGNCKTPDLRKMMEDMKKQMMAEMIKDSNDVNKRMQRTFEQLEKANAKAAKKKGGGCQSDDASKAKQTKVKIKASIDQWTKQYVPQGLSLFLYAAAKPKSEFPFVDYKAPVFGIGGCK